MQAALALPVLALPMRAGAVQAGEVGVAVLAYRERGLMRVNEPLAWVNLQLEGGWNLAASAVVDSVSGASPRLVSNASGTPVQSVTAASIGDRRVGAEVKAGKRLGDITLTASRTRSDEEDYRSRAYGLEARWEDAERLLALTAGYGKSNDRVRSADNPNLDAPRVTEEFLAGFARVLSPVAVLQSSLHWSRGEGRYDDPYKLTLTFYPDGSLPVLAADRRPDQRASLAWLTRYRQHVPAAGGTFQADYRLYRDDWGVRAHTVEVAWSRDLDGDWALRPALRYATQSAADFYSPTVPRPRPPAHSSDQRLAAFGSLSPSLKVLRRLEDGLTVEATVGAYRNDARLRWGGGGSPAFVTLRAWYLLAGFTRAF